MFTDPNTFFNQSAINQSLATIVNGTMTAGSFQAVCEVPGMDLLISLVTVQTIFIFVWVAYMILGRNLRRFKK